MINEWKWRIIYTVVSFRSLQTFTIKGVKRTTITTIHWRSDYGGREVDLYNLLLQSYIILCVIVFTIVVQKHIKTSNKISNFLTY